MANNLLVEKTIHDANILRVGVWTNGPQGGDGGHGGRTVIEIQDCGSTAIDVELLEGGVRVELRGDSELETIIEALEFAAQELRRQSDLSKPALPLEDLPTGIILNHTGVPSQAILSNGSNLLILLKNRGGAFVTTEQALMALDINRDLQRRVKKFQDELGDRLFTAYLRGVFCDHIHTSKFTAHIDLISFQAALPVNLEKFVAEIEQRSYERFGFPPIEAQVTVRQADPYSDWYFDMCDEFYAPVRQALFWE